MRQTQHLPPPPTLICPWCGNKQPKQGKGGKQICYECKGNWTLLGKTKPKKVSETNVSDVIAIAVRAMGWIVIRVNSGTFYDRNGRPVQTYFNWNTGELPIGERMPANSGFPDLMAIHQGRIVLLEVKLPGKEQGEAQVKFARIASNHGMKVHVVTSVAEAERVMRLEDGILVAQSRAAAFAKKDIQSKDEGPEVRQEYS